MYKNPKFSYQHSLLEIPLRTLLTNMHHKTIAMLVAPMLCLSTLGYAQEADADADAGAAASEDVKEAVKGEEIEEPAKPEKLDPSEASIRTRPDARTMTLSIPAPRGQITDRFGYSYAQNTVVWYPALQMKQFEDESDEFVLAWARERLAIIDKTLGTNITLTDKKILEHYQHRRWLPMPFKKVVRNWDRTRIEKKFIDGIILHPIYQRVYPQKSNAAHIIGYTGSTRRNLEEGPINYGDPLFWEMKGRAGLEHTFDDVLKGKNGQLKLQYNSMGQEVSREETAPEPGGTVVTTIDMDWQRRAESVLSKYCKRGAFVVIDIESGDVLVLASRPSYDLNLRVPFMKQTDLDKLLNDPAKPLFARAFQGQYPPASAFKVVTGLAALHTKGITPWEKIECPAFIKLGNIKMYDWSRANRGHLDIKAAITVSNNPFFIQASLASERLRPGYFMNLASQLGYGTHTGLPLHGEKPGSILTEEYAQRTFNRSIKQGDIANASIGQGAMLATPLQVAQSMAGIGNEGVLPKLNLIKQLQNSRGEIIMASKTSVRYNTRIDKKLIKYIKDGMFRVVNTSKGTGKRAATSYSVICGKTGTAQWGPPSQKQNLAWFAGFFPLNKPKYAFAVLYEGAPFETISGGKKAAPMVPAFFNPLSGVAFNRHYVSKKALIIPDLGDDDELEETTATSREPGKAILVDEIEVPEANIPDDPSLNAPRAMVVEEAPEPNPVEETPAPPEQEDSSLETPYTPPAEVNPDAPASIPDSEPPAIPIDEDIPALRELPLGVDRDVATPDPPARAIPVE